MVSKVRVTSIQGAVLPSEKEPQQSRKGQNGRSHGQFVFHMLSFLMFLFGLCWHVKASAKYSSAAGIGHYSKFFSFWGFLGQFIALFLSLLSHLFPDVKRLEELADDFSSAVFGHANVICVFYILLRLTNAPVEDHPLATRPIWLALLEHAVTVGFSWIDIIVAQRSFRQRAFEICMTIAVAYVAWIHFVCIASKAYPYPFLNDLPQPEGFIMVALSGLMGMYLFFEAGSRIAARDYPRLTVNGRRGRHK